MCKVVVARNGSVDFDREEWWSATNNALGVKQSFPGKFSLGRYLVNKKYKPINGAEFAKNKNFRTGFGILYYESDVSS